MPNHSILKYALPMLPQSGADSKFREKRSSNITKLLLPYCTHVETVLALPYNGGTGIYSTTCQYGGLKEYEFY